MFYLARLYKEHCPHCYHNMGCSLRDRGLYDKAIYCWQKTLDLDENYPQVQVRIAEAYWGKGELEAARQHYLDRACGRTPATPQHYWTWANCCRRWAVPTRPAKNIRRAIELAPEEPGRLFLPRPMADAAARSATTAGRSDCFTRACSWTRPIRRPIFAWAKLYAPPPGRCPTPASICEPSCCSGRRTRRAAGSGQSPLRHRPEPRRGRLPQAAWCRSSRKNPDGWQNLAVAQFLIGRYDDGIASCKEALPPDPQQSDGLLQPLPGLRTPEPLRRGRKMDSQGILPHCWPMTLLSVKLGELRVRVPKWKDKIVGILYSVP